MANENENDEMIPSSTTILKDMKGRKYFIFEDTEHQNEMLENLNMLRKNRQFCDVILQIGSSHQETIHEIYAHKVVLSCSSPYLLDKFMLQQQNQSEVKNQNSTNGHNSNENKLSTSLPIYRLICSNPKTDAFDPEAFDLIIDYAYTAILKIPSDKVREIYTIASKLKMSSVALKCGQILLSMLSIENCLDIRNMKSVLRDLYLLQSIDSYIKQHFSEIVNQSTASFESRYLPQIKIEFLLNSEQEELSINDRHMFNEVLDWLKQCFQRDEIDLEKLKESGANDRVMLMLYYNKDRNEIQDCCQIETNSPEETEMVEDYKKMNKRMSLLRKSLSNDSIPNSASMISNGNGHKPSKPRQFLFTRSDSESSLSSVADDEEMRWPGNQDWKLLANCRLGTGNHTLVGLVSIAGGQLYLLSIVLRVKDCNQDINQENHIYEAFKENPSDHSGPTDSKDCFYLIPSMNSARCAVGTAEFDGKLLVCGGYDRGECLKTVEIYNTKLNRWELLPPMQVARGRFSVAVIKDKDSDSSSVYAIGGSDGQNELSSAECFENNHWRNIRSAPEARSNAGVCCLNGKIYMIGGWNGNRGMTRCDAYDPQTDQWIEMTTAPLNTGRYQMGCCVLNNLIYAVGGCDSWSCLNSVECYKPDVEQWRLLSPLQTARRGCGVAAYGGKIYAVGGHDGVHALCSVEVYDPEQDEWTYGKPMTQARANVGVAVVDNKLYAVGGFNGKTFLNTIEYYDFENDQWTTSVTVNCNGNKINNLQQTHHQHHKLTKSQSTSLTSEPLEEVEETVAGHYTNVISSISIYD